MHPPIPKKPAITPKPSVNKLSQKKNGTSTNGKSPVPKPKPRVSRRLNGETPSVPSISNNSVTNGEGQGEKNNGVVDEGDATSRHVVTSQVGNGEASESPLDVQVEPSQNEALKESLEETGGVPVKIENGQDDSCSQMVEETAEEKPQISDPPQNVAATEVSKSPNVATADVSKSPQSSEKPPVKRQPPPLKPRTRNPNSPRRALSVVDASSNQSSKPEVKMTKSHSVLVNGDHSNELSMPSVSEEPPTPIIPVRKKRLSRGVFSAQVDSPHSMHKPESNPKLDSNNRSTEIALPSAIALPSTAESSETASVTSSPSNEAQTRSPITSSPSTEPRSSSPARPPLPSRRIPLKDCVSSKVDEDSPPPIVPRRTDTNGNPATSSRTRAKSEYIKKKPVRPPPPAVKPSLSVSLPPTTTPPPPKHPKPTVRKSKSQFIPKESPLGFTTIDINIDDDKSSHEESTDSPRIPPRKRHSKNIEKHIVATETEHSNPENFVLKQTIYDTETDTVMEVDLTVPSKTSTQSSSQFSTSESESNSPGSSLARKSMPLPPSKKTPPRLTRSLTEPETNSPPILGPRPKIGSPRKAPVAPPIPVKPVQSVGDIDTDSNKSVPAIPKTPPLSPKCLSINKSHHSSPKHKPRLPPPPPPPPVERITDLPDHPRRNLGNRSKSLDTSTSEHTSHDRNGNVSRTPKNTVENENAKNSSKLANYDMYCNRDSEDSSSSSTVQSSSDYRSMSSSITSRNSVMSEDDDYVLPDPQSPPLSPPLSPRKPEEQIYTNKQVASVRPSRRVAPPPPRPAKPNLSRKTSLPASPSRSPAVSPPTSPSSTCPVSPSAFSSKTPGSGGKLKKKPPAKPVRRSLSINSDISNDGYEDMSKGSSLASSLGIGPEVADLYSVPR